MQRHRRKHAKLLDKRSKISSRFAQQIEAAKPLERSRLWRREKRNATREERKILEEYRRQYVETRKRIRSGIRKALQRLQKQYPEVKAVILTGSTARGKASPRDVDLFIIVEPTQSKNPIIRNRNIEKYFKKILEQQHFGWSVDVIAVLSFKANSPQPLAAIAEYEKGVEEIGGGHIIIPKVMPWHVVFADNDVKFRRALLEAIRKHRKKY